MKKPFVFISYSTQDVDIANLVHGYLEGSGISCWIASRNIEGGESFAVQIVDAINDCAVFLMIASGNSNMSSHVSNELSLAFSAKKKIIPFRVNDFTLSKSNLYFLQQAQWIDAYENMNGALKRLLVAIRPIIPETASKAAPVVSKPIREELIPAKESTCTENGNNEYYYCAGCGKYFKDAEATVETTKEAEQLPLVAHHGGEVTCTKKAVCDVCGQEYGEYAPHQYVEKVADEYLKTPATCVSKAVYFKNCSVCGQASDTETFEYGELTDHSYDTTTWKSDKAGHWHACTVCGDKLDFAEHTSNGPATEYEPEVCTECGYIITPALGHTHKLTLVEGFAATCTEDGQKSYYVCDGCGKWFEDATASVEITDHDSVIIKAAHTPSDWIVDKKANETEKGSQHKECTVCGTVLETQEISAVKPVQPTTEPSTDETQPTTGSTVDSSSVQTGDSNIVFILLSVMMISLASIFALDYFKKCKRSK